MKFLMISLSATLLLSGCYSNQSNSIEQYLALSPVQPYAVKDERIANFVNLYNHLESSSLEADVTDTYAELIYFNDTLVTLHSRDELIKYLEKTQKGLDSIDLTVLDVFENKEDIFVHWIMDTRFSVLGKRSDVKSLGFSHLRFDPYGKIVLHHDYWDSTNGFFQHVPLLGGLLQWIKTRLHS